uniref:uncharacterized protein LOC120341035 n=1 Tax=Styela clava TaxID=7725 RepID=UPI00193A09D0|nr:uncharacterized protein LOC120341035 [Styela clava]
MWKFTVFLLFVAPLREQVSGQDIVWNRFPTIPEIGFPVDCVKRWGECIVYDGGSYRVEEVVVDSVAGGECNLNYEFDCDSAGPAPVDCVTSWGPCQNGIRREFVTTAAQNGGKCVTRTETCATVPPPPVDCTKAWGQCRNGFRLEIVVRPAKNGGTCFLDREECGIDCVKEWGRCINGFRREQIITPARNGGECPRTRLERCAVDCQKRWDTCVGEGPSSARREVVVVPARNGGKCILNEEFGCRPFSRVNCVKEWGKCKGNGPSSVRVEIVVTPAKHGGTCELREEYGCRPFSRVNCVKKWGKCEGNGPSSVRVEIAVTPAKHGGNCELREEYGCRFDPVDCVKKWGRCSGSGSTSKRVEEIVSGALYGGKTCKPLKTEFGCRRAPVDCVKTWSQCTGKGETSQRKEIVKTSARNGGKPCKDFKVEMGCDKSKPPVDDENGDDTPGKELATLFLANLVSEPSTSGKSTKPVGTGARSLNLDRGPPPSPADLGETDLKKNCTEKKTKDGKVIALGCDNVDNIDPEIKKEVEIKAFKSIRKGEKQPPSISRRKRSERGANPVSKVNTRDILIYLDSSGSVGPYRFETLKEVCKAIVDVLCGRIALGKYQTRIALATFNARQLLKFPFTKTDSVKEVKNKIQTVGYDYVYSYQSCIRDALEFVLTDIYTAENGARDPSYAEGDMIMITDGCANCDFDNDGKGLQRAAYRLKLNKINVYAIGVGIEENCRKVLQVLARGGRCFHFFFLDNWDIDVEQFLYRLKRPPQDRCLDKWEYPGVNCLKKP